jgi:hypothetical protein
MTPDGLELPPDTVAILGEDDRERADCKERIEGGALV